MSARNKRPLHIRRWISLLLVITVLIWYYAPPKVYVFYAKDATESISYVLDTQHTIVRGGLNPGETTGDVGHIFPDEKFFMRLDWWSKKIGSHCANITPKWPTTEIHIDRNGNLDGGTDTDRLTPCRRN